MPTFGEYLKLLMENRKIGVNDLADLSGVSGAHISRIINGKRSAPAPKTLKKIATALNESYEELMKVAGHITSNNTHSPINEDKKPKDLQKILDQHEIMFSGTPLTEEDKQAILDVVELQLYKRAKELNKRKKDFDMPKSSTKINNDFVMPKSSTEINND